MRRLSANVWVEGKYWPAGCRPPQRFAEQIGEHAWEDGDPTVPCPTYDESEQPPTPANPTDAGEPPVPPASVVPSLDESPVVFTLSDDEGGEGETPDDTGPATGAPTDEPPRAGRGASTAAWTEYATALGVPLPDGENPEKGPSRDEIIAAVDAFRATSAD